MKLKITVLGCLGAYPYKGEGTSSYLLESDGFKLLLDAGSTTLVNLEEHLDPLTLDAVILSHYHYDHIADLGVLQYYRQLYPVMEPTPVLPIYGHTEDSIHFEALNMPGVSKAVPYFEAEELKLGFVSCDIYENNPSSSLLCDAFCRRKNRESFCFHG